MERRPPSSARPRIPGGYGNYAGRDPESPPPATSARGAARKKRSSAPWGGLFEGQEQVALPTAPWEAGAPLHGRPEEDAAQSRGQYHGQAYEQVQEREQQQEQWQYRNQASDGPAWARDDPGAAASDPRASLGGSGGSGNVGRNSSGNRGSGRYPRGEGGGDYQGGRGSPPSHAGSPPIAYGDEYYRPPPPQQQQQQQQQQPRARRRSSPLVHNAPRLTILPPLERGGRDGAGGSSAMVVREGAANSAYAGGSAGGIAPASGTRGSGEAIKRQQQQQQSRGPQGAYLRQSASTSTAATAATAPSAPVKGLSWAQSPSRSVSASSRGGDGDGGGDGWSNTYGNTGDDSRRGYGGGRDVFASSPGRGGQRTPGSSSRGAAGSRSWNKVSWGALFGGKGSDRSSLVGRGDGFGQSGKPSPFLTARSSSASRAGGGGDGSGSGGPTTWRSPLEQSAVNPFSASFGTGAVSPTPGGPSWVKGDADSQSGGGGSGGGGGGGGGGGKKAGTGSEQPLLRGSVRGGYGSRWEGGGASLYWGGGASTGGDSKGKRPVSSGHKVDDQGRQIFYKHGVRLVEAAEIQLEALGRPATYTVFIMPYLILALALWLDMGHLDVTSRSFPPGVSNGCDDSGRCGWSVTGVPMYNSYLTLKAKFTLVDDLVPSTTSVSPAQNYDAPAPASAAVATPGKEDGGDSNAGGTAPSNQAVHGGGRRSRRRLSVHGRGSLTGAAESWTVFNATAEGGNLSDSLESAAPGMNDDTAVGGTGFGEGSPASLGAVGAGGYSHGSVGNWTAGGTGDEGVWEKKRRLFGMSLRKGRRRKAVHDVSDRVRLVVAVGLKVEGATGAAADGVVDWDPLYRSTAKENVQFVDCYTSDHYCDTTTLARVVFDSPGTLGQYPEYRVNATLTVIQDGEVLEGGGGLLAKSGTFELETEKAEYVEALSITRLPLLALTTFFLLYWMTRGFGGAGGERDPAPSAIVPERRYITMLLFGLLLWQNPVLAVEEWIMGGFGDGDFRWARLARDLCQFTGMQLVWLCWVCLMDGQHFVRKSRRTNESTDAAYRSVTGDETTADAGIGAGFVSSPRFLKDDTHPPHHPKSHSFIDFMLPKLIYGVAALMVGVALAVLRHPVVAKLDTRHWLQGKIQQSYAVLSVAAGVMMLGWAFYFAMVAVSSGRVLRGQSFMATRRQQLSYRVMLMQGFLVAILLGLAVGRDLTFLVRHLIRQQTVQGASSGFSLESMTNEAAALSTWTGGIREPLGKLLLISAVCYNLAYLFLPPAHSVKRLFDRMYINMERDMPPREVVRRYKDSKELSPLFCVETSCLLMEVAWQAYYDPHKVNLSDFIAPGRQDLSYLGLELVAYIEDEETETRAVLCRGRDRLVLAFRGTARVENLLTDLKFHQVPLPQLLPQDREPINIRLADGQRYSSGSGSGFLDDHDSFEGFSRSVNVNSVNSSTRGMSVGEDAGLRDRRASGRSSFGRDSAGDRRSISSSGGMNPWGQPRDSSRRSVPAASRPRSRSASPVPDAKHGIEGQKGGKAGGTSASSLPRESAMPPGNPGRGGHITLAPVLQRVSEVAREPSRDSLTLDGVGDANGGDEHEKEAFLPPSPLPSTTEDEQEPSEAGDEDESSPPLESISEEKEKEDDDDDDDDNDDGGSSAGGKDVATTSPTAADGDGTPSPRASDPSLIPGADGRDGVDETGASSPFAKDVGDHGSDTGPNGRADADGHDDGGSPSRDVAVGSLDTGNNCEGAEEQGWSGGWNSPRKSGRGGDHGFGGTHEPYEMGDCASCSSNSSGMELDFEGAGGFGEGDFDIDRRGDGSFTSSAARCFKAVIHKIPVARQALPRVHGGFWEAYEKLRQRLLSSLASEMQSEYRPLYITGHSLGGALASLAAYDIDKNFDLPDPLTLYTFGSPRVGNAVFSHKLNSRVKHHFRVVNDGDIITAIPRFFGTYKHAGCKVVVDSERYGHFIVEPTLVEQTFGAKPLASVPPHLLGNYRECLEACMEEADLEDYFSRGHGVDATMLPEWLKGKRRKDALFEHALV